jgi:hypothetical protein
MLRQYLKMRYDKLIRDSFQLIILTIILLFDAIRLKEIKIVAKCPKHRSITLPLLSVPGYSSLLNDKSINQDCNYI